MYRLLFSQLASWTGLLVFTPVVFADQLNGGQGLYGEVSDKVSTYAGLILVVGFPVLITVLSILQGILDHRKEERLAALAQVKKTNH